MMRAAYVLRRSSPRVLGIAGYFNLFSGAHDVRADRPRAGAFKDPNVFGPFLIWPRC